MADFTQIIQEINADINTNGVGAITGAKLNDVLRDMIAAVNAEKQDPLTIDATPTEDSTNPVQSGGVYNALNTLIPRASLFGGFITDAAMPNPEDSRRYFLTLLDGELPNFEIYNLPDNGKWKFIHWNPRDAAWDWETIDSYTSAQIDQLLSAVAAAISGKQDTISDLATIRSGAAAGETAYQKPSGGIPKTDLASGVQTSLGKADTAVQQVTVGTTTTGNAGTNASVTNSGTSTAPVLDFTIPRGADGADGQDGADAVNPFKGWWPDLAALKAAHTATAGDSAYVKDASPATTWSIYVYDATATANNNWVDSGLDADTSNVQTFASGEEVNEVGIDNEPSYGSNNIVKSGGLYKYTSSIEIDNANDTLYISDDEGYAVTKIGAEGLESIEVKVNDTKLSDFINRKNGLFISDENGYVIAKIDADGIKCHNIQCFNILGNDWNKKTIAVYGDSVTAQCNGDYSSPYTKSDVDNKWAVRVANYYNMSKMYGRGIGGQGYEWATGGGDDGGSVSWVTPAGVLINRLDEYDKTQWDALSTKVYPSGVTAQMIADGDAITIRGSLSSWLRITSMFPQSIKDDIDVVLVMAHNDGYDSTDCAFVVNDTTDSEWAASGNDYYGKIGGDYNINTLRGAIASTIMKLQLWMPQAVIVIMSGISGHGTTGVINTNINTESIMNIAEATREMSKLCSIPLIDTFANDGINGWNRLSYISDSIHPNYAGNRMLARAIIVGLKTILPIE